MPVKGHDVTRTTNLTEKRNTRNYIPCYYLNITDRNNIAIIDYNFLNIITTTSHLLLLS